MEKSKQRGPKLWQILRGGAGYQEEAGMSSAGTTYEFSVWMVCPHPRADSSLWLSFYHPLSTLTKLKNAVVF